MNIIEYLIYNFLLIFIIYKGTNTIFNENMVYNKKIERLSYILYYIFISSLYLINGVPVIMMIFNLICIFLIQFNYKIAIKDKMLLSMYLYLLLFIMDLFIVSIINKLDIDIFTKILKISDVSLDSILIYLLIFSLIIKSLKIFKNIKFKVNIPKSFLFPLVIVPFMSICLLLLLLEVLESYKIEFLFVIIVLLILNVCVFLSYNYIIATLVKKEEKNILEQKYLTYVEQFEIIKDKFESLNMLKHDIKKHFMFINQLILDENYSEVLEYINELNNNILKENEKIVKIDNPYIDTILNLKLNEAIKNNIKIKANVSLPYDLNISTIDMVCLIGNILDNCIEANLKLKENERYIFLKIKYYSKTIFINVYNKYNEIILDNKGNILSSKMNRKQKYGVGIKIIKKIVENYNGLLEIEYNNNNFNLSIILNLKDDA